MAHRDIPDGEGQGGALFPPVRRWDFDSTMMMVKERGLVVKEEDMRKLDDWRGTCLSHVGHLLRGTLLLKYWVEFSMFLAFQMFP